MLLVSNDQAEIGKRQEKRGACADDDARPAFRHTPPAAAAARPAEIGMPYLRLGPEAPGKTGEPLAGQCDLGQQDQHLAAGFDRRRHRLEIDLGLAGAGDAVQQGDRKPGRDRVPQHRRGVRLLRRQRRAGPRRIGRGAIVAVARHGDAPERAGRGETGDHPGADPRFTGELRCTATKAVRGHLEHPPAGRGHADVRQRIRRNVTRPRRRRLERLGNAHRHAQHSAARRQGVTCDPVDEVAQRARHRRAVEPRRDILEAFLGHAVRIAVAPHHAGNGASAQRNRDEIARR